MISFYQVWIISFQISYNVNHKVINGQFESYIWFFSVQIILIQISHKFPILSSDFLLLVITFFQKFLQIYTTHRSFNAVIW